MSATLPAEPLNCRVRPRAQCSNNDTAYTGASHRRKQLSNWNPRLSPADADLLPELGDLVARSRDLDRNNGVAAGSFQALQDNVIGIGLRLAAAPDYRALGRDIAWAEDWSRNVESQWKTWADSCSCDASYRQNFMGLTQLVFRSALQSGEALSLPLWLERPETPWRTCLQMIDTDRLSNPGNSPLSTRNLRGGIRIDNFGRPLSYFIQDQPPDFGLLGIVITGSAGTWTEIPAETSWGRKRVIHVFEQTRVDQNRGAPILAPVIEQFRMLDAYQRTELQSAIVNAIVAGVIETPMDAAAISDLVGTDPNAYLEGKNQYRVQLEGGSLVPLYPGDKLIPYTPSRPVGTFPAFVETLLRQIGAACGLPYELVLKDFSKTNYSSARAALLEAWRFFMNRRVWVATYWCQPVYELWLEEAINAGKVEAPDYYENRMYYARAKWIGPGRGWIDPVKEAQAAEIRMTNMVSTLEIECAEQGLDWNEVLEQLALEKERKRQLDLLPEPVDVAAPAADNADGGENADNAGNGETEDEAA